jgi:hypothetical protein
MTQRLMRLKSEIWVKAYVRRRASHGHFAVVARHGDDEAGAIYIKINRLDGTVIVFGPAPGGLDDTGDGDRQWMRLHPAPTLTEAEADALIERAGQFDADLWLVEVEDRTGGHGFAGKELISN